MTILLLGFNSGENVDKPWLSETSADEEILKWRKLQGMSDEYNEVSNDITSFPDASLSTLILRANLCQLIHLLGSVVTECGHVIVNIPLSIIHRLIVMDGSFSFASFLIQRLSHDENKLLQVVFTFSICSATFLLIFEILPKLCLRKKLSNKKV